MQFCIKIVTSLQKLPGESRRFRQVGSVLLGILAPKKGAGGEFIFEKEEVVQAFGTMKKMSLFLPLLEQGQMGLIF